MKTYFPCKRPAYLFISVIVAAGTAALAAFKMTLPLVLIFTASAALISAYILWYFSVLSYTADSYTLTGTSGVIFRKKQSVRISSVQYYTSTSVIFSRYTGLNFVSLYSLGGKFTLMYLSRSDAQELLSLLKGRESIVS